MATWAKGLDFKNSTNTARIGGIGVYGTDTIADKLYIGLGAEPWNNSGLEMTSSTINFKGNKIYHQGDKPTPSEIGAAASSHNHTSLTGVTSIAFLADSSDKASIQTTTSGTNTYFDFMLADDPSQEDQWRWRFTPSGGTEFSAMVLDATSATAASLHVAGDIYASGNKVYHTGNKPTLGDLGAAATSHTHTTVGPYMGISNTGNTNGYGISLYGGASASAPSYGLMFQGTGTFGTHGSVTGDWATYFTMSGATSRGWIFKAGNVAGGNVASISATGAVTAASFSGAFIGALSGNATTATTLQNARTINGTSFNGSANITTAIWGTPINITVGNTVKSINGSSDILWTLSEIGAAATSHTHSYLPLSGGTLTGTLSSSLTTGTHINGNKGGAIINSTASGSGYNMLAKMNSTNGVWTFGSYGTNFMFYYTDNATITAGTNSTTKGLTLLNEAGNSSFPGIVSAPTFSGALSGNASTATKLQTARTINGTNFDGSAAITTALWGTPINITVGNTTKSVNGSVNIAWSLAEIGAATSAHTHNYLPLSGGTITMADYYGVEIKRNHATYGSSIAFSNTTEQFGGVGFQTGKFVVSSGLTTDGDLMTITSSNVTFGSKTVSATTFSGSLTGNATSANTATSATTATTSNYLASNSRMDYGWNGLNYFNISGTAGAVAKANDTPTTAWWHIMRLNHANGTGYYTDLAIPFNDTSIHYKRITGGSVQNGGWVKVLDSLNYNSYSPTKTGGGASGTWGISVTGNAATSTALQTTRTINGTSFNGTANITTALWGTPINITVGNTTKSVNGSANIAWSLTEIGAATNSHTHNYLPLTGGTLTGALTANGKLSVPTTGSSWVSGKTIANAAITISTKQSTGSYHPILAVESSSGNVVNIGGLGDYVGFYGFQSTRTENGTDWSFTFNSSSGAVSSTGTISAPTFSGALSGNATTATTLQTARTITIGSTGKTFNGSANVAWTLSEIGAAATSHNHTALTGVTSIGAAGASSSWGSLDITGAKGGWQGIHFKDYGYVWMVRNDGYTGMWKNAGNAVFAFDQNGSLATGSVPWSKLSGVPSSFTPSSHNHGLLHDNLTCSLTSTTTDTGWSMINSSYNGFLLKSIRSNASAPNWICNNYGAGIAFGGADTKGVMSVAYNTPMIKFAGGNGTAPVWWIGITGNSGTTYNINDFATTSHNHDTKYAAASHGHDNYVGGTGSHGTTRITNANDVWKSGFYDLDVGANVPFGGWTWLINSAHSNNTNGYKYGFQIVAQNTSNNFAMRTTNVNGEGTWNSLWHNNNFNPDSKANSNHTHTDKASLGADVSFSIVRATSNGQGTNFAIGDDCWLGDINEEVTVRLAGQDGSGRAFLKFGNGAKIGYNGSTAFEVRGNTSIWGNLNANVLSISGVHGAADFYSGGGDGASFSTQNVRLNCWWGFGIQAYDNKARIFFDSRKGDIAATGNIYTSDGHGEGRVSGFEPNRAGGHSRMAQGDDTGGMRLELFNGSNIVGEYVFQQGSFWTKNYSPLGNSSFRWGQIYSTSGSISTSDSRLKENITPISKNQARALSDDDTPTSYDFYNYIKGASTYTFNYKKRYTQDTQTWLGVLADEIPDNIFDKVGTWSKTEEEYLKELEEKENAIAALESMPQLLFDDEKEEYDFGNKIVEGTKLTFRELKQKAEDHVEEPIRMLNSSSQIAMLQEVLSIALNKIESLENILKEKGLY